MSMTYEDYMREMAIEDLAEEQVMERAKQFQCIYLFVEGKSEEKTFPYLIKRAGLDLEKEGVIIANYNGNGNLIHSLRLLNKTLSNNRPVIITIDNDETGAKKINKISNKDYKNELIEIFPIPVEDKVKYKSGYTGGSFEEMFKKKHFINCCFTEDIMPQELVKLKSDFIEKFDNRKPWYKQIRKFCAMNGYSEFSNKKVFLAEYLAEDCENVPKAIQKLVNLIKKVRNGHPIKHPYDVELPKVRGLTYFSDKKE